MTRSRRSNSKALTAAIATAAVCALLAAGDHSAGFTATQAETSLPKEARLRIGSNRDDLPSIRELIFSPGGKLIATRGEPEDPSKPRKVQLWNAETGNLVRTFTAHEAPLTSIQFSSDGRFLAAGQPDHALGIQIWDVKTGRLVSRFDGGRGRVHFLPDGKQVAVVAEFGSQDVLRIHDVATGKEVRRFVIDVNYQFVLSPDGTRILSLPTGGRTDLILAQIPQAKEIHERPRLTGCKSQPTAFVFSGYGRTVAAGSSHRVDRDKYEHRVIVWELATAEIVHELKLHTKRVLAIAFSPDGRYLATGSIDKSVKVWELATGKLAHTFSGHRGPVSALAFSPDGRSLASGGFDKTVLVWDLAGKLKSFLPKTPPKDAELTQLWEDLASATPTNAYRAIGRVEGSAAVAMPYLKSRLQGILFPEQNKRIQQLIVELDDEDSQVRHRAMRELRKLRKIAKPILLKKLAEPQSAEVRFRLLRVLEGTEGTKRFSTADIRRMLRLIQLLERQPGKTSEEILQMIVKEFPEPAIAKEAKRVLERRRKGR